MANVRAKFEVSSFNRCRDMEGSQNFKSKSRDPVMTPFDLILHFLLGAPVANLCAKFGISSFNRSRDMEGVPKFTHTLTHSRTHSLTDTQTDF